MTYLLPAVLCGLLSGCVVSHSSSVEESGRQVGESTLAQLEPGVTTQAWTRAVLGEPTRRQIISEDNEIWVYEYTFKKENRTGIIVLLGSSKEAIEKETVYLEFEDGLLEKHWKDR